MRSSRTLFYLWFAALLVIALLYLGSMIQESRVIDQYEGIVRDNSRLTNLILQAREIASDLDRYYAAADRGALIHLNLEGERFLNVAAEYRPGADNADGLFHHRNIRNMLEHILNTANRQAPLGDTHGIYYDSRIGLLKQGEFFVTQTEQFVFCVTASNMSAYESTLRHNRRIVQMINLVAITILVGVGMLLSTTGNQILRDIQRISRQAQLLSDGNWNIEDIGSSHYIEINDVIQALDTMKRNTAANIELQQEKRNLEQSYNEERIFSLQKDRLLREAKIQALQMQINPHFLFNTFNMISRSALLENKETTISLIESIANIMRYTMSSEQKASLKNELDALQSYLHIQRIRFQDTMDFTLSVCVEQDTSFIWIPPLIIQPIVENAIIHGVSNIARRGKVDISVAEHEGAVIITITDNGKGIEEQTLERLRAEIASSQNSAGIGIGNVAGRLRYWHDDCRFTLISKQDSGTAVTLRIPLYANGVCLNI